MDNYINIIGARENNLKNVSLVIPRNKLTIFTGVSGSGKSSLAFDTIFAEGQMRYVESLSSYARMFLGQYNKPDVDAIEGLSPTISIQQKSTSNNPRSTVGTVTEIYDYLRLLWARIGIPHCPKCGRVIKKLSVDEIVSKLVSLAAKTKFVVLSPIVRSKKGEHKKIFEYARKNGFMRVRVDGIQYELDGQISLDKNIAHNIEIVIDRLQVKDGLSQRLSDSIETALKLSGGVVIIYCPDEGTESVFSHDLACPECGVSLNELSPHMFSFNSPYGACKTCSGLGFFVKADIDRIIPDRLRSIRNHAINSPGWDNPAPNSYCRAFYDALGRKYGFDLDTPIADMDVKAIDALLYGTKGEKLYVEYHNGYGSMKGYQAFEGIAHILERRYRDAEQDSAKKSLASFMSESACPDCSGDRLVPELLAVTLGALNIAEFCKLSVLDACTFMSELCLTANEAAIAEPILRELKARLGFLKDVGLGYLTLSRISGSLSGGEAQRIRLATQIGSGLTGILYILDEPSIGLHQRDSGKLLSALKGLRDLGNTLIVVEHDEETIRQADWIVDIGPHAGTHGGEIVAMGKVSDIIAAKASITGQYLSHKKYIPVPNARRTGNAKTLTIKGAAENNLKNINVSIPLGTFTCVTGVSGSGKSSLINEILYKTLVSKLNHAHIHPGKYRSIEGVEYLDKVICIDQSPIGRTPRSNPATYTGLFDDIRTLFAMTHGAKEHGYGAGRFSFNIKGGRCEACSGNGMIKINMHFLPDLFVQCDVCKGKRYNRETLEVFYKNKNIADVLEMTAEEALNFFGTIPRLKRKIGALCQVGLGYIKLGQSSTTLSGGEAQRVKLAAELLKPATGSTIYIFDEPTTGLHMADIQILVHIIHTLVEGGNTAIVIEHNLDLIKNADYIIDLGPEGGEGGGNIICCGTPEQIAGCNKSYTGSYLKKYLR